MKSAITTIRATPAITMGFPSFEVSRKHEKGDAGARPEQDGCADNMKIF
jgi:hypothetical protein